ncbi:MAG TPA: amino acid ABC transporter permease [Hyphomicrobiaceae bacterium]|nr:amino acid ABC transporter permease [Hyphomicrobiaceae bacterium]
MMQGYIFNWSVVWRALPELAQGLLISVEVALLSISLGMLIGGGAALARTSQSPALSRSALIYVELMRNSPSLVKMYFIYFGLPSLGAFPSAFTSSVVALSLHNGAYMTEIFRGGLLAVPRGQIEAARSLGMGTWTTLNVVILPQAFRNSLPALSNIWVEIIKDTSLTSALAVKELFYVVSQQTSATLRTFEFLAVAALIYLVVTAALAGVMRMLEHRGRMRR